MPLTSFSRAHKFINTLPPNKRDGLLKSNVDDLQQDESIFQRNIIEYYENRPDTLDEVTLAEFVSHYNLVVGKCSNVASDSVIEDDNIDPERYSRSEVFNLKNNLGHVKRRNRPAIIRYYIDRSDEEAYAKNAMLLFYPFKDETKDVHQNANIVKKYNDVKENVDRVRNQFEPGLDLMYAMEQNDALDSDDDNDDLTNDGYVEDETTSRDDNICEQKILTS